MKTRRTKQNRSPLTAFGRHVKPVAVDQGHRLKTTGARKVLSETKGAGKDAKPVFIGRVYTGMNTGKKYPYASTKRQGSAQA